MTTTTAASGLEIIGGFSIGEVDDVGGLQDAPWATNTHVRSLCLRGKIEEVVDDATGLSEKLLARDLQNGGAPQ